MLAALTISVSLIGDTYARRLGVPGQAVAIETSVLTLSQLTVGTRSGPPVIEDVDLELPAGEIVGPGGRVRIG